jgi:hypothetical protein
VAFADPSGIDQLARYCSDLTQSGSEIGILIERAGLRRLLSRPDLASLLRPRAPATIAAALTFGSGRGTLGSRTPLDRPGGGVG